VLEGEFGRPGAAVYPLKRVGHAHAVELLRAHLARVLGQGRD
jgi:hypothetical protein